MAALLLYPQARSKQMNHIVERLKAYGEFEIIIFGGQSLCHVIRVVPSGRCTAANPQKRAKSGHLPARAPLKAECWSDLGRKVRSSWTLAAE
jgi:hypothetical protein